MMRRLTTLRAVLDLLDWKFVMAARRIGERGGDERVMHFGEDKEVNLPYNKL